MNISDILRERKSLYKCTGRGEYLFFTSILISAAALCAVFVLFVTNFLKTPEIASAYGEVIYSQAISGAKSPFVEAAIEVFYELLSSLWLSLPSTLSFLLVLFLVVCPVYEGTIRWSAYLVEKRESLPISAILFYFSSPRLYFKSVYLSIRLFARKLFFALLFLIVPFSLLFLSLVLGSDYYGQKAAAGAVFLLSLVLFILCLVLYVIFCQRYAAVRYLFALGNFKKLFRRSAHLTSKTRAFIFTFNLRLIPNLLLLLPIITAPFALSRILCAKCLMLNALIAKKKAVA